MMRRILSGVAISALVIAAALLGNQQFGRDTVTAPARPGAEPGYAARDAVLIETGTDGRPLYTVDAEVIRQQPNRGVVMLDTVRVDYRGEGTNQWALSAQHGMIQEGSDIIELSGKVHAVGMLPQRNDLAQIFTEQLRYDPHQEVARIDAPVRLQMARCEMDALGLTANFKDQTIALESRVHGNCS